MDRREPLPVVLDSVLMSSRKQVEGLGFYRSRRRGGVLTKGAYLRRRGAHSRVNKFLSAKTPSAITPHLSIRSGSKLNTRLGVGLSNCSPKMESIR